MAYPDQVSRQDENAAFFNESEERKYARAEKKD
jgi:hypothetical protein